MSNSKPMSSLLLKESGCPLEYEFGKVIVSAWIEVTPAHPWYEYLINAVEKKTEVRLRPTEETEYYCEGFVEIIEARDQSTVFLIK